MDMDKLLAVIKDHFYLQGNLSQLPGDTDKNYLLETHSGKKYIIKLSPFPAASEFIAYQKAILKHLEKHPDIVSPVFLDASNSNKPVVFDDYEIWVLAWIDGELWSKWNFKEKTHYTSLGSIAGKITKGLSDFDHQYAHRYLEWDLAQVEWVQQYFDWFEERAEIIRECYEIMYGCISHVRDLRKQVIHNDVNENNIIVERERVKAIIDFGDAIFTQVINDVAIACMYASMDTSDPLQACNQVIKGYHKSYPLQENELIPLYGLIMARILISLTKSTINKIENTNNEYHQVSAQPAWDLLQKWRNVHPDFAHYTFRSACGYPSFPEIKEIKNYLINNRIKLDQFFPDCSPVIPVHMPMDVESMLLGTEKEYVDPRQFERKIERFLEENEGNMAYGAYMECRPFYITEAFKKEGLFGPIYRTIHLGEDYWMPAGMAIHTPLDGEIYSLKNNNIYRDYGPTIILKHQTGDDITFFTLYGHLSEDSLGRWTEGDRINRGDFLARVGNSSENGSWAPHLHFQIISDLLGNKDNFPGVGFPDDLDFWKDLTPNPHYLIDLPDYPQFSRTDFTGLIERRKNSLGPNLSLSYDHPLHMVRGNMQYLIDAEGQKFLDLVNNVAHVGHENPKVVKAGQEQMAVLNTNSRYLHTSIVEYADALLQTLPDQLEVVYFTNSGSEANELALRMAETYTGGNIHIAIEGGYHGNTNKCISVSSYKFNGPGGKGKPDDTLLMDMPDVFRGKYTKADSDPGLRYARQINNLIHDIGIDNQMLSSFISESIMSCGGQIVLPDGYLKFVYDKIRKAGGLCIADEVQTGFGRVGEHFWAFQIHGVVPDIVTLGKPIGNGHPIGAVICTREVALAFDNGMEFFNTYGGNPVSCRIGLEVLKVIKEDNLQHNALIQGNAMFEGLIELKHTYNCIADVRGKGLFLGVEIMNGKQPDAVKAAKIINRMRREKILLSTDGPDHNVIKIKPPIIIDQKNVEEFLVKFRKVIDSQ